MIAPSSATAPKTIEQALIGAARTFYGASFTAEELVVRAFELDPQRFGLDGYKVLYPDSQKIMVALSGSKGLVGRGHFVKLGPKLYKLRHPSTEQKVEDVRRRRDNGECRHGTRTSECAVCLRNGH